MNIIAFLVVGTLAGLLARALMPGNQSQGWLGTMFLGVIGSFIGGGLGTFFARDGDFFTLRPSGFLWSTVGALLVLAVSQLASRRAT
ncbi:MAG: GlsB/YeaQ/YmgE family stress response membrane protein [Myxococcaceae bacterium]